MHNIDRKHLGSVPSVLVIQETSMHTGREKVRGILEYAKLYGPWKLHLVHGRASEDRPTTESDFDAFDGVIVGQMTLGLDAFLAGLRKPLVHMDPLGDVVCSEGHEGGGSAIRGNSEGIVQTAVEFLSQRKYTRFAYVGETANRPWSMLRGAMFAERIRREGHDCAVFGRDGLSAGPTDDLALADWLRALEKPVALLAAMDECAHRVISICNAVGIRVPADIAVLGVDNDDLICNGISPTISSIPIQSRSCGFEAAGMLDRMMRNPSIPALSARYGHDPVVVRESTEPQPEMEPIVRAALDFIRVNACGRIAIADIVAHVHASRRLVETRFRNVFGHTLLDEIQAVRLERTASLLRGTDLSVEHICGQCGYVDVRHLGKLFRDRFGMSMRAYRLGAHKPDVGEPRA